MWAPRCLARRLATLRGPHSPALEPASGSAGTVAFAPEILFHLRDRGTGLNYLDMTFGDGGHSQLLLDRDPGARLVASDCDAQAYQAAVARSDVLPLQARISELPGQLQAHGWAPGSFDVVLLDTGCSERQLQDPLRGFAWSREAGRLDLRLDPDRFPQRPTGSEVLQRLDERQLTKIIKYYGGVSQTAKHVASAMVEARYLFHTFKSVEELYEILTPTARQVAEKTAQDPEDLLLRMVHQTLIALRAFVNDELHELEYGLRVVAENYLKPQGLLFVISRTLSEDKVIHKVIKSAHVPTNATRYVKHTEREFQDYQVKSWLVQQEVAQYVKKTHTVPHPKFKKANFLAAQRTTETRTLHKI
eukprot:maker-scaffold125_size330479-snap-gene-0.9 protein:Tk06883 transcript:maker-scaffold125_size330479-snap-gene-0.9-mRNA-1 annotation:"s-adenosyl-l-methionine-dependent methyltransferase mett5d1"